MKIAVFEAEQWEHTACRRLQPDHELFCTSKPLTPTTAKAAAGAEVLSPFVNSRLSPDVMRLFPQLKLVATRSTGYDHIDLAYCAAYGVTVSNVPGYGDVTVAEHVFALLLGLSRRLVEASERTRRGDLSQTGLRGFESRGKTLGVIGAGRIGRRVAEIARGFGMIVLAADGHSDHAAARRIGFTYAPLTEILSIADVLTLHTPATADTTDLISDREFSLMKPGAVLINTARGQIVNVAALIRALSTGKLRAAGLDVHQTTDARELETLVADHLLLRLPQVLVTPHNAYNTDEALPRIIDTTLDNIEAFTRGRPRNAVTL